MKIGVIGLGKLGLPLALVLSKEFDVVGVELSKERIDKIRNKDFKGYKEKNLMKYLNKYKFTTKQSFYKLKECDVVFCIVPTPSKSNGEFTNDYIKKAIKYSKPYLKKNSVFVITSTVMPGSCQKLKRLLPKSVDIAYNPEFIALGNVIEGIEKPDFVLIGADDTETLNKVENVYFYITNSPIKRMSLKSAELTKIALNSFVTMKISFANSIGRLSELHKASAKDILEALGTDKRIGNKYLKAGSPFGGPCFPRDNRAMKRVYNKANIKHYFCEITDNINTDTKWSIYYKIKEKLKKGMKVSIIGTSYKIGTEEKTESAGIWMAETLEQLGYKVYMDEIPSDCDLAVFMLPIKRKVPLGVEVLNIWQK